MRFASEYFNLETIAAYIYQKDVDTIDKQDRKAAP